jgi:hypothetical protein
MVLREPCCENVAVDAVIMVNIAKFNGRSSERNDDENLWYSAVDPKEPTKPRSSQTNRVSRVMEKAILHKRSTAAAVVLPKW